MGQCENQRNLQSDCGFSLTLAAALSFLLGRPFSPTNMNLNNNNNHYSFFNNLSFLKTKKKLRLIDLEIKYRVP